MSPTRTRHLHASVQTQGFTLLELVIALAVSSLVALMATAALSFGLGFSSRMNERLDDQAHTAQAERLLREHWSQRAGQVEVEERILRFTTAAPLLVQGAAMPGAAVYHCQLDEDADAPDRWVLMHYIIPMVDGRTRDPVAPQRLISNLTDCRFSFLRLRPPDRPAVGAPVGAAAVPTPEWVSKWPLGEPAPQLVRAHWVGARAEMPERVFAALRASAAP